MTAELRVRFLREDDGYGQLVASVRSGAYAGTGAAYFYWEQVEQFVQTLRACPLAADRLPKIEGGYWSKEDRNVLQDCHLRIAVRPFNLRGQLMMLVDLKTEPNGHAGGEPQQSVSARFQTEYQDLDVFGAQLLSVIEGTRDYAILPGKAF